MCVIVSISLISVIESLLVHFPYLFIYIAAERACEMGLHVWLGVMVGSTLNSATTAHLLSFAVGGDMDGSLLVCICVCLPCVFM